jgi:hypothetical protein
MRLRTGNSFNQKITLLLAIVIGLKLTWRYL